MTVPRGRPGFSAETDVFNTNSRWIIGPVAQPITFRENRSITTARYSGPCHHRIYVRAVPHAVLGRLGKKWRLVGSGLAGPACDHPPSAGYGYHVLRRDRLLATGGLENVCRMPRQPPEERGGPPAPRNFLGSLGTMPGSNIVIVHLPPPGPIAGTLTTGSTLWVQHTAPGTSPAS
jgi:hypothetical protein